MSLEDYMPKTTPPAVPAAPSEKEGAPRATRHADPRCTFCGKPAACFGRYDTPPHGYACDECCGHSNEDGHCVPVDEVDECEAEIRDLQAEVTSLRAAVASERENADDARGMLDRINLMLPIRGGADTGRAIDEAVEESLAAEREEAATWRGMARDGGVLERQYAAERDAALAREERRRAGARADVNLQRAEEAESRALAAERDAAALREALEELADLVDDHVEHGGDLDTFSTQPARRALASGEGPK